jgi:MFS transporter, DHA1 family, multidrug resistance protein
MSLSQSQTLKNPFWVILTLGAMATISPFTIDMYLPAFAQIALDFNTSRAKVGLSLSSYFAGMALGPLIYGPLLDRFGRKMPVYCGLMLFVLTSLGCLLVNTIDALIALRFLQALGGCVASVGAMTYVKDLFPPKEIPKIISLLILTIGVSPLVAPTLGGFVTAHLGWHWIFAFLAAIVIIIMVMVFVFLPEGHPADTGVSLKPLPILKTYMGIYQNLSFTSFVFVGAFSTASLFIYVAGSPTIFMDIFKLEPQIYGLVFAVLSIGLIGASQVNIVLNRYYTTRTILKTAVICQFSLTLIFLIGAVFHVFNVYGTIMMLFLILSCTGLIGPNASATAILSLKRDIGSASALMSFSQIGMATLMTSVLAILHSTTLAPIAGVMAVASLMCIGLLFWAERRLKS